MTGKTEEHKRLEEARTGSVPWKAWGPYLSERQWGTVREDYSENGDAWNYFTHEQARSRAYRWGEDGIAGICDERQRMCLALALWNGQDPILKERMFGLNNSEGNHGEDVKEYWFYLDSTPTHSYLKCQYKYPQRAFPYLDLVQRTAQRSRQDLEYELLDTGIFDEDRYFDVIVEYAKAGPDDILMLVTAHNRGPDRRRCTCSRRSGSVTRGPGATRSQSRPWRPLTTPAGSRRPRVARRARRLAAERGRVRAAAVLRERDEQPAPVRAPNASAYAKDGINDFVVDGAEGAVNPDARDEIGGSPRARGRAGRQRVDPAAVDRGRRRGDQTAVTRKPLGDGL